MKGYATSMPFRKRARSVLFSFYSLSFLILFNVANASLNRPSHPLSAFVFRRIPPLEEELGSSPTISRILARDTYYFDPLQLATDDNFAKFRECELKHGRVAMLGTIGMIAPSILRQDSSLSAWNVIKSLSPAQYIQILLTCAFLEAFVFCQQDPKDMPGDYQTGYFGIRDKGRNERSMISELENGRLAMLAFVVQIILEFATHKSIVQQWEQLFATVSEIETVRSFSGIESQGIVE